MIENQKTIKVMLIEDNSGDARLLQEYLKEATVGEYKDIFVDVRWFNLLSTGQQYLSVGSYDVVLLDMYLPDCKELECIEGIRAIAPHIPIIVLSGTVDEEIMAVAISKGAKAFISKNKCTASMLLENIIRVVK